MNTGDNDHGFFYTESAKDAIILERNVKDHPASAVARLLLLGHYKINNDPAFTQFAKQTSLYFNNPYWLQLQLSRLELYKEASNSSHPPLSAKTENVLATVADDENELKEETIALASSDESIESKDAEEIKNHVAEEEGEHLFVLKNENTERLLPEGNAAAPVSGKEEEEMAFEPKEESPAVNEQAETINNNPEVNEEEGVRHEYNTANTDTSQPVNNTETTTSAGEEEVAFESREEIPETDQPNNITSSEDVQEEPPAFVPKEEILVTGQPNETINNVPAEKNKDKIIPFEQVPDIESSASGDTEEELPAFEPLHTVDYFASQGIKIKEEALMDDKLGKQMKSFTAWLKSMKKLHPGKLPEQNEVIERIIQSSAEESNADAEVLTEAMAEVLIKQNKEHKAIEMYQKLSLLNPLKSAYFAAKIENIKNK